MTLISLPEMWALVGLALITVVISKIIFNRRSPKVPPGPKPWPIIGSLHLLGSLPHKSLHKLSRKYGEIMLLKFGNSPVVVASSPEMAKQFLKVHDTVFASRPPLAAGKYLSYNYSDMVWAPYGPHWRLTRRIYQNEVFNAKSLDLFQPIRAKEGMRLLSRLRDLSGKPVVLKDHLQRYTLSNVCSILSKDRCYDSSEEDRVRGMVDEWFLLAGAFNIGDWVPWLSFLDLQGYVKRMKALHKRFHKFSSFLVDDHLAKRAQNKASAHSSYKDFVDVLLDLAEDPTNLEVQLTTTRVTALIQNLIIGSVDTSATTVEWAIYEVVRHPRILTKAKEELDRVIGRNRLVEEEDSPDLPYIDCILMEIFRLHPLATLLSPRYAMEDCEVAGYEVSKGTMVLINSWSIGRDPELWDQPEEFLPERFMGKQVDMLGSDFTFLPFGSGRRKCPGYSLGLKMVRKMFANLLHGFDFKLVDGMRPEDVSIEEEYGLTTHPKHPLTLLLQPTLPSHLYS